MIKYSRQREAIKGYLDGRTDHPTADAIYMALREEYPKLSLGTVYRNLNLLAENEEIIRIHCEDIDHFDYNTKPHYHFVCKKCKCVYDIPLLIEPKVDETACDTIGKVEGYQLVFQGVCQSCREIQKIE